MRTMSNVVAVVILSACLVQEISCRPLRRGAPADKRESSLQLKKEIPGEQELTPEQAWASPKSWAPQPVLASSQFGDPAPGVNKALFVKLVDARLSGVNAMMTKKKRAMMQRESRGAAAGKRVVFSLTTTASRIQRIKPGLDSIVEGQITHPDVVYLAVPPEVKELPEWLQKYDETTTRPGVLKVLHMKKDYGPASKLLAAVAEGGEKSPDTIIIYGDDDMLYGNNVVTLHVEAQKSCGKQKPHAFGTRRISLAGEPLLEATGTISLPASAVPMSVFGIEDMPPVCRLSDDFWISHHLAQAGVQLEWLPRCQYSFSRSTYDSACGSPFEPIQSIMNIGALSARNGNWQDQLRNYTKCGRLLNSEKGAMLLSDKAAAKIEKPEKQEPEKAAAKIEKPEKQEPEKAAAPALGASGMLALYAFFCCMLL